MRETVALLTFSSTERYYQVNVDAFQVGDFRKSGVGTGNESGHGEHGGDAKSDTRRRRVTVQPERHPRQNDDQTRRHVDLNDVVAETSHEVELARQPRVITFIEHQQASSL